MNEYADYDYSPYDDEHWDCNVCGADGFTDCDCCMIPGDEWEDWYPVGRGGRDRKRTIASLLCLCFCCPPDAGENYRRGDRRRNDRYKNKR